MTHKAIKVEVIMDLESEITEDQIATLMTDSYLLGESVVQQIEKKGFVVTFVESGISFPSDDY